jgi:hypothetical protein
MDCVAIILLAMGAVSAKADGLLEVRAGAGMNGTNLDDLSVKRDGMNFENSDNYNLDLFLNLPGPFGVGLRNEWFNTKGDGGGTTGEIDANNLSLLVDFRILDNWIYLGPIAGSAIPQAISPGRAGSTETSMQKTQRIPLRLKAGLSWVGL